MAFDPQTLHDLCVICCDSPDTQQRGTAHRLLCHEQASRLRSGTTDWNRFGNHPGLTDDSDPDFVVTAGVRRETRVGGLGPAAFYFYHSDGVWEIGVPQESTNEYATAFPPLLTEAETLSELFRETMSNAWVDAKRHRVDCAAAAGSVFATQEFLSYTDVTSTNVTTGQPVVTPTSLKTITLTTGTWRVQYSGAVRSEAAAPGAIIGFSLALDGVDVADQLIGRAVAPPGQSDRDVVMTFNSTNDLVLVGTQTLTLLNSTSSPEFLDGLVRFWQVA